MAKEINQESGSVRTENHGGQNQGEQARRQEKNGQQNNGQQSLTRQGQEGQGQALSRGEGGRQSRQQGYMVPPVDVYENESGITLLADLPGVSRERLGVRVDGDSLVIEGTTENPGPENLELVYGEVQYGAYRRQFTLSRELDASRIEAQLKDGVLQLTIPKAEEARPRRIQVNVA
jgi:HSP20 family protein